MDTAKPTMASNPNSAAVDMKMLMGCERDLKVKAISTRWENVAAGGHWWQNRERDGSGGGHPGNELDEGGGFVGSFCLVLIQAVGSARTTEIW